MEKSDLTLSTFVKYEENFQFSVNVAGRPHRLPETEIAKCFVSGLKPDIFREKKWVLGHLRILMMLFEKTVKSYRLIAIF